MWEQGVVLEDRVHVAGIRRLTGDVRPSELDRAAVGALEPGDDPQQSGLARAGGTEHREELALGDLEVDPVGGHDAPIALAERGEADCGAGAARPRLQADLSRCPAHRCAARMSA